MDSSSPDQQMKQLPSSEKGENPPPKEEQSSPKNDRLLIQLQAVTGLVIAAFTSAHLANHFVMHWGIDAHRAVFTKIRKIYTAPLIESILLGSIGIHSGIALIRYRGLAETWSKLLYQVSGWYLLTVMPIHVTATRYMGSKVNMAQYDVTYAAMAARILPIVFIPYYVGLAAAGAIHMLGGIGRAGNALGLKPLTHLPWKGSAFLKWSLLFGSLSASSALAIAGVYFKYPMPEEELLIHSHFTHWPRFITKFIQLPTSEKWFGSLKWPNGAQ